MAYGNQKRFTSEREKNPLDNPKLKLAAPSPGTDGKRWATWQVQFFTNFVRVNIYSNNPADENARHGGRVQLKLPMHAFGNIIQLLIVAVDPKTPNNWKKGYQCLETRWKDDKPSEKPMLEATVWVGKDENGVICISVAHWNKESPRIVFQFGNTIFNRFINEDGSPLSDAEASVMWTKSYIDTVGEMLKVLAATQPYHDPKKDQDGGNNNRGGGGRRDERSDRSDRGDRSEGGGRTYNAEGRSGSYNEEDESNDIPF